jgi:hypothetical protein
LRRRYFFNNIDDLTYRLKNVNSDLSFRLQSNQYSFSEINFINLSQYQPRNEKGHIDFFDFYYSLNDKILNIIFEYFYSPNLILFLKTFYKFATLTPQD